MADIHPYLTTTTIIEYEVEVDVDEIPEEEIRKLFQNSYQEGSQTEIPENGEIVIDRVATGFFYAKNSEGENPYLITNKHVVVPEYGKKPESLIIKVREMEGDNWTGRIRNRTINLETNNGWKWLDHPDNDEIDVVAIPVDKDITRSFKWITESLIKTNSEPEKITDYDVGYDCVVIGYPIGFRDEATEFPIVRRALISTPRDIDFLGQPRFLIDAKMHGGMSGSPVFEEFPLKLTPGAGISYDPANPKLIGIHSASWVVEEDLQLNDVWRADLIPEIITSQ